LHPIQVPNSYVGSLRAKPGQPGRTRLYLFLRTSKLARATHVKFSIYFINLIYVLCVVFSKFYLMSHLNRSHWPV
jgi:hypothetical protein